MADSTLPVLFLLIIIVLLLTLLSRSKDQRALLELLSRKINKLNDELYGLSTKLNETKTQADSVTGEAPVSVQVMQPPPPEPKNESPETVVPAIPAPLPVAEPEYADNPVTIADYEFPSAAHTRSKKQEADIEKFIGENLANKIGIAVLVLGIAFFIKYAIDKDWIREAGRVVVGMVSGAVLIGIAHYYRNQYRSFSSVLVGGGLTVFYFSIAFAFHQYQLISQLQAFIAMVLVAGIAVVLSLYYNRQELAVLATLGGFITPFLVSTGQHNHVALFTYLCIVNASLTALSWFKRWPAINIISLVFTVFIYGGWLLFQPEDDSFPSADALIFATLFYLLFIGMNIVNTIRLKREFTAFYFIVLLSVHFLYYVAGMYSIDYSYGINEKGIFTLALGLFTLLLTGIFYKRKDTDPHFVMLLMGLSLTFISLTAPVWLRGNHITLFWMAEAVVLYYLFTRSRIPLLRISSGILTVVMLFSLVNTWAGVYLAGETIIPIVFNKGYITGVAVVAGLLLFAGLIKDKATDNFIYTISNAGARNALLVLAPAILYLAGMLEIHYQFNTRIPQAPVYAVYGLLYTFSFVIVLQVFLRERKNYLLLKLLFTAFCLFLYAWYMPGVSAALSAALNGNIATSLFGPHWLSVLLLGWILYDCIRYFVLHSRNGWQQYREVFTWIAAITSVVLLSTELFQVLKWISYTDEKDWAWWYNLYVKAGLSITWGLCSFTMMWLGMRHHFRPLRIISLTLFTITLVKLFFIDIRNIPPGGKIAAFILLGILLLVVSFMYQRLKKIIIDDKPADTSV